MGRKKQDPIERWERRVFCLDNGCWFWTGFLNKQGYGTFPLTPMKNISAYRFGYIIFKGEIPKGFHLDHLCRNPFCVNPNHLEAVTPRVNTMRGIGPAAKNVLKTHCPKGHPYSGHNLPKWGGQLKNRRYCRECQKAHNRDVYKRLYASPNYKPRYVEQ